MFLEDEIDDLEQCSRRYSIRINCVPESEGESTVVIIKSVAKATDDEVTDDMIDRSHRMGPKSTTDHRSQATVVKFTSYRHKGKSMAVKKKLFRIDAIKLFPEAKWPALPPPSCASSSSLSTLSSSSTSRIAVNDDLTKTRAQLAAMARDSKRRKNIDDTWVRSGVIVIKKNDSVYKVTTKREFDTLMA